MKRIHILMLLFAALASSNVATVSAVETLPGTEAQPTEYFFTGRPYDQDLGGYVFANRTYTPRLTRWYTSDPSGFPDGANSNRYAPTPNSEFDYAGLEAVSLGQPPIQDPTAWQYGNYVLIAGNLYQQERIRLEYSWKVNDFSVQGNYNTQTTASFSMEVTDYIEHSYSISGTIKEVTFGYDLTTGGGTAYATAINENKGPTPDVAYSAKGLVGKASVVKEIANFELNNGVYSFAIGGDWGSSQTLATGYAKIIGLEWFKTEREPSE